MNRGRRKLRDGKRVVKPRNKAEDGNYAEDVLKTLKRLRDEGKACDFEVRTHDKSYRIHRCVFIATTSYDLGLTEDGHIELEENSNEGVEACIEYMYSGRIPNGPPTKMQKILTISVQLCIVKLTKHCIMWLKKNLTCKSCLATSQLFQQWGTEEDKKFVDEFVVKVFDDVVMLDEITDIPREEVERLLSLSPHLTFNHWNMIEKWIGKDIEQRQQYLPVFLRDLLQKRSVQLEFLLKIWKAGMVQRIHKAKAILIKEILRKVEVSTKGLDLDSCFDLKDALQDSDSDDSKFLNRLLNKFLSRKFEDVMKKRAFVRLSFQDFAEIISKDNLDFVEESWKWETIRDWVMHDEESRIAHLPKLLAEVDVASISAEYILKNMRNDALLYRSPDSFDLLERNAPFRTDDEALVVLDSGSGVLVALDPQAGTRSVIKSFDKRDFLRAVSVGGELYVLQNDKISKFNVGNWEPFGVMNRTPEKNAQVVVFNNDIYIVEKSRMFFFSLQKNTCIGGLQGCDLGAGFCVVAADGFLYAFGGWQSSRQARKYSLADERWTNIAPLNVGRRGAAAVVHQDKIYVLGGAGERSDIADVESYDDMQHEWKVEASLSEPSACHTVVVYEETMYLFGGSSRLERIQVFDSDRQIWVKKREIFRTKGMVQACVCDLWKI